MKFLHLSDLHLGKRVNEFPMIEEQSRILDCLVGTAEREGADAVVIAGDVYDRSVPCVEAVGLFDDFLTELSRREIPVLIVSGNHDSPERIAFGGRLLNRSGVYLSPVYRGRVDSVTLRDPFGEVHFYLLPFLKPAFVRPFFPDAEIADTADAVKAALASLPSDRTGRNVLVAHQFVTGAVRSESEEVSVGGSDNVDASLFDGFDYVALGHLHRPQNVGRETVRYCGSPLKYSFSEAGDEKSVSLVELNEKGNVSVRTIPLQPMHDMRELRGSYAALTLRENYGKEAVSDYLHITLTDEEDIPEAMRRLQVIYPNLMRLDYDNRRTRADGSFGEAAPDAESPLDLFCALYEKQNGGAMSDEQKKLLTNMIAEIWEREGTR